MDTLTVLRDAREWLSDPAHWNQGDYGFGSRTCAAGACQMVLGTRGQMWDDVNHPVLSALRAVMPNTPLTALGAVASFNDTHSHADVLALFDRAIAAEEAKADPAPTAIESEKKKEEVPQATPRRRENAGCERVEVFA